MESIIVVYESLEDASASEISGYHVFSALAALFRDERGEDPFFHMEQGLRPVAVSRLHRLPRGSAGIADFFAPDDRPVKKGELFGVRISFLIDAMAEEFLPALRSSVLRPGKFMAFRPVKILSPDDHPLCGKASSNQLKSREFSALRLRFLSPTGFNRSGLQIALPLPELVFSSLLNKWNRFVSPGEWQGMEEIFASIRIERFDMRSRPAQLKKNSIFRGCVGYCDYSFHHLEKDKRRTISALAAFSFYAGVGYKTTQGMGQVQPEIPD